MALLKNGRLLEDRWVDADSLDGALRPGGVLVPLELWKAERLTLRGKSAVGVVLPNTADPAELAGDYERLAAVALQFPAFADGRAFSQARVIREKHGFKGEIRARGPLIPDQYLYLLRCGFDAVELPEGTDIEVWLRNARRYTTFYQPAADDRVVAWRRRHATPEAAAS
ncbi:MAG: DUF934 domain-containing protein [Pseudomonadota bacterium]|nr:DUF934 domain-containing protein [Pseudomonadota bacterium]